MGNHKNFQSPSRNSSAPPKLNIKWVTGEEKMGNDMIEWAKEAGRILATANEIKEEKRKRKALTTSQIRKFYGEVRRIYSDFGKYGEDAPMLNAKLAYAVGRSKSRKKNRNDKLGIEWFWEMFEDAIKKGARSEENFRRLVKILEATVAYHKFYGGSD